MLRMDLGTENGLAAAAQIAFRRDGADALAGEKSVRYGTSPANSVCLKFVCNYARVEDA